MSSCKRPVWRRLVGRTRGPPLHLEPRLMCLHFQDPNLTGLLPKPAEVLRLNVGGCLSAATTPESCRNGGWPTQNQNRIGLSPQTAVVFGIPWVGVHGHDAAECCTGRRAEAPTFRTQTSGLGNRPVRKRSRRVTATARECSLTVAPQFDSGSSTIRWLNGAIAGSWLAGLSR